MGDDDDDDDVLPSAFAPLGNKPGGEEEGIASMLESTYRPGTLTMLECRFNKTTHHAPDFSGWKMMIR